MKQNPNSVWFNLGQRIAALRRSKGISQLCLSEMANISKEQLNNLERVNKLPSTNILTQIASALNISLNTLITIGSTQSQMKIDTQIQSLLNTYSIAKKDVHLTIFRNIECFSAMIKTK